MQFGIFSKKGEEVFAYEDGQTALYESRIAHEGHTAITAEEAHALLNPPEPPITAEKLKEIVTAFRWQVETGGITLPSGAKIATALDDQYRITTVVANARLAGIETVKFKTQTGFVQLSIAEVEAIAAAVARHVQHCFAVECMHHAAIDAIAQIEDPAARQEALENYDESQGWDEAA